MRKTVDVPQKDWKAGPDDGLLDGQFRALVSVFGNKDSYGDVIRPGAFKQTLKDWKASGNSIPVYWSHQLADPDMNVGWVVSAEETDKGLEVVGQFDLDGPSPKARQAYHLLKGKRTTSFSFSYDVVDGSPVTKDGDTYNELRRLKLYELGPTQVGANPATELLAVKAAASLIEAEVHAGHGISPDEQTGLRDALASMASLSARITNVLAAIGDDGTTTPTETASTDGPAKDEEPEAAKSEEPSHRVSATTWGALIDLTEMEHAR